MDSLRGLRLSLASPPHVDRSVAPGVTGTSSAPYMSMCMTPITGENVCFSLVVHSASLAAARSSTWQSGVTRYVTNPDFAVGLPLLSPATGRWKITDVRKLVRAGRKPQHHTCTGECLHIQNHGPRLNTITNLNIVED